MDEDKDETGEPGWWKELSKNRAFWYVSSIVAIVVAAVYVFNAIIGAGADLPGAVQTARESGRLPSRCEFDPAAGDEALIVILPFYVTSSGSSDAHSLIHEAIEEKIGDLGLENTRVEIDPNVILQLFESETAQELGEGCNAAVVIWGAETRTSISVNFLNIKEPEALASDERVQVLAPETLVGAEFIEGDLPRHLAFLALFAIGQAVAVEGEFTEAIPIVEKAVANISEELIAEELASNGSAAAAYFRLGWLYQIPPTQNFRQAKDAYEKSLVFDTINRNALGNLGGVYHSLGQYETAMDYYDMALATARENGDNRGEGDWLGGLGIVYESLGQYETAMVKFEQAVAIAREIGDRERESIWLGNLGNVYENMGQYETAEDYYEQALAISREIGIRGREGSYLGNLGLVYQSLGQYEKAKDYYELALAITRETGNKENESVVLGNLGDVYQNLGQYETARDYSEQALAIAREIGDRQGEGVWLSSLGVVYGSLGQYETARDKFEQGLAIAREIGDRQGEGSHLGNLGIVFKKLGQYERAQDHYDQALTIAQEIGDLESELTWLGNLGNVYLVLGQYRTAKDYLDQALTIAREIGDRQGEGTQLGNLGIVYWGLGEYGTAISYLEEAVSILEEIKSPLVEDFQQILDEIRQEAGRR